MVFSLIFLCFDVLLVLYSTLQLPIHRPRMRLVSLFTWTLSRLWPSLRNITNLLLPASGTHPFLSRTWRCHSNSSLFSQRFHLKLPTCLTSCRLCVHHGTTLPHLLVVLPEPRRRILGDKGRIGGVIPVSTECAFCNAAVLDVYQLHDSFPPVEVYLS